MYVLRLKNSEDMFLDDDGSYTTNPLEANSFGDYADARSYASDEEEVVEIDSNGNVVWVE